jgi:CBS domain-containing protein
MLVSDILRKKGGLVISVAPGQAIREAGRMMAHQGIGSVLVMDGERIVGILSERDIVAAVTSDGGEGLENMVSSIMTAEVITCPPGESIKSVMEIMTAERIRHLPVVDEGGDLCGVISIGDVVKHRLEETQAEVEQMEAYVRGG